MKIIEDVVRYSAISTSAGKIYTENGYSTRLQINVLVIAPFGTGKSSLFIKLKNADMGEILTDYTLAGLVGTVRPNGQVIRGFLLKCIGKSLIVDEYQKFGAEARDAILNLMENHFYTRVLTAPVPQPVYEETELYKLVAEQNYLHIEARLSYIIGCMYFKVKTMDDLALLSRSFPISLTADEYMGFDLYLGKEIFSISKDVNKLRDIVKGQSVKIDDTQRNKLVNYTKNLFISHKIEQGFITRGLWDLSRIAGINAIIDGRDTVNDDDIVLTLNYLPLQVIGYARGQLTPAQVKVLDCIYSSNKGVTTNHISKMTKIPDTTVDIYTRRLESLGLVKRYKVGGVYVYYPVILEDMTEKLKI